ncbi:MAG: carbon-nitrogen hydrolase family protein [Paracoccaceae bacterium]|nr:carbon-nitrogen hydrolase family protein [Paracoccaceae bacterium]
MRLGVLQAPAALDGVDARLNWLAAELPGVAAAGVQLVVLPELFATGYHIGAEVADLAEASDGPIARRIADLAKRYGVAVLYGYPERAGEAVFNAALCIGPDGATLGHHRKLAIPPGFEKDVFQPGAGCTLFDYAGLSCTILICYDAEFPEAVRHVAQLGAQVVLVPTALGQEWAWVADTMIPTRAYENGVYLAYANHAGVERGKAYLGRSVIAGPDGAECARAGAAPGLITATLSPEKTTAAQARLPYVTECRGLTLRS